MNYISNRNYGCRLREVIWNKHRVLSIENDKLFISILLDKGADILEFNYKKTDTDFMWRSPAGMDVLEFDRNISSQHYVGGWFELFPNTGEECSYNGVNIPFYGDIYQLPWEYSVCIDEPEILKIKLFSKSYVLPLSIEKELTLEYGRASLYIKEKVSNNSKQEMCFTWGHHPNIGAPFLNENCVIELPEGNLIVFGKDDTGKTTEIDAGKWPFKCMNGIRTDLRILPSADAMQCDLLNIKNMDGNWAIVKDTKKKIGFQLSWDNTVFKSFALWRLCDVENWRNIFGNAYLACFLIKSSHHFSLTEAVLHDEHLKLQSGKSLEAWITAAVLEENEL